MAAEGFHEGELAVQRRAGVPAPAARLGSAMLSTPDLSGGVGTFLEGRDFAASRARAADRPLWTFALLAARIPEARDRTLTIHSAPGLGDAQCLLRMARPWDCLPLNSRRGAEYG